ncbi:unnamed protein product [Ilex paraguariensis]|uniref:Reverse transcriptase zinc-binding domain-containing protein n=1 Tax=Ilex paraguariensis TaxID=185542 RepID=A0ABC8QUW5_9AQUA
MKQEILESGVFLSDKMDRLIWKLTDSGEFTVKSAWQRVRNSVEIDRVASVIWKQSASPSARHLSWKIYKNAVLVDSNFQRIGVMLASKCVLCGHAVESVEHVFIQCEYSVFIWRKISAFMWISVS